MIIFAFVIACTIGFLLCLFQTGCAAFELHDWNRKQEELRRRRQQRLDSMNRTGTGANS